MPTTKRPSDKRNILITGTPGTGKTLLSAKLEKELGLRHINLSKSVKEHALHDGHDSEFDTLLLNEDKVIDWLEPQIGDGLIVEAHSTEYFPLRYFDLVVCLTSSKIYERLAAREYSALKITENIECEIFGICQEQAREFPNCLVLSSDNVDELAHNIKVIKARYLENAISSRII